MEIVHNTANGCTLRIYQWNHCTVIRSIKAGSSGETRFDDCFKAEVWCLVSTKLTHVSVSESTWLKAIFPGAYKYAFQFCFTSLGSLLSVCNYWNGEDLVHSFLCTPSRVTELSLSHPLLYLSPPMVTLVSVLNSVHTTMSVGMRSTC